MKLISIRCGKTEGKPIVQLALYGDEMHYLTLIHNEDYEARISEGPLFDVYMDMEKAEMEEKQRAKYLKSLDESQYIYKDGYEGIIGLSRFKKASQLAKRIMDEYLDNVGMTKITERYEGKDLDEITIKEYVPKVYRIPDTETAGLTMQKGETSLDKYRENKG